MRLLPQKEAVRVDLAPFDQETKPLAKIRCVNMEDDAYQPSELKGQLRVMDYDTIFGSDIPNLGII